MRRGLGISVLQIAMAFFLIVAGVQGLMQTSAGELGTIISALNKLFRIPSLTTTVIFILSISELIAGIFLIVEFFAGEIKLTNIILSVFVILWIINTVLVDIIAPINNNPFTSVARILTYLTGFSQHLMVLGSLLAVINKNRSFIQSI